MQKSSDFTNEEWILIGRRIRTRRRELCFTQMELAENVDVSTNHISGIERGIQHPSFNTIKRISEALEVTPDYFVLGNMHSHNLPLDCIETIRQCDNRTVSIAIKLIQLLNDELATRKK